MPQSCFPAALPAFYEVQYNITQVNQLQDFAHLQSPWQQQAWMLRFQRFTTDDAKRMANTVPCRLLIASCNSSCCIHIGHAAVKAHLHMPVGEQVLHERTVSACHAGVVNGKPERQQVLQRIVQAALRLRLQHLAAGRGLLRTCN